MRKRVQVLTMERGETKRGVPGVFGEAIVEDRSESYLVRFSRLDGERSWYADSMIDGDNPIFSRGPGERSGTLFQIRGKVATSLTSHLLTFVAPGAA